MSHRLSKQDQLGFARQLLTLLQAGLALLNAIELIYQTAPKSWHAWLQNIHAQLKNGYSLSQCLRLNADLFSMELINLISVSERTGDIELALTAICEQLEAQIELRRKVQQALAYPLITLTTSLALVIVMMVWVVPVFKDVFANFQAELPGPTRMLIQASSLIEHYFLELGFGLVLSIVTFYLSWAKSMRLQRQCDRLSFRLPILGPLLRLATLTHWCRTLGHLISSGLSLPDALRVTAQSSNHWLSHDFSAEVFKQLTRGWPLGESLTRADPKQILFDLETLQLLRIASESGSLDSMLCKRANILGSELSNRLNTLSQTLEPLLIVIVGIIIGSLVIILYLPIFNLGQIV
ncbi:type II secretion system F family protein [Polynucleobacter sp. AP-Latsch-80-C2]|jgi:type IV pilus assembly protein PilC|uniref:type II secretion system F family protein n=1 Tax=Polynucleobacter sp. AP-Latsch-80-C2 TaxID=2576931 RepID=UPI001C0B1F20|nr:type II secretion system F family protein [Polynucleobacter sp. AP-Latsch-80-C2]MBU3623337.1 type II secretion system F family protein [Polynucleobacter sp. AP-Latsch-80-C2]